MHQGRTTCRRSAIIGTASLLWRIHFEFSNFSAIEDYPDRTLVIKSRPITSLVVLTLRDPGEHVAGREGRVLVIENRPDSM